MLNSLPIDVVLFMLTASSLHLSATMPIGRKSIDSNDSVSGEDMNKRILDLLEELTDSKYAGHFPGHPSLQGIEAYEQFASNFFTAFSDLQATVEDFITEGDKVAVRQTWRGTHTGNFEGIAPTSKQV